MKVFNKHVLSRYVYNGSLDVIFTQVEMAKENKECLYSVYILIDSKNMLYGGHSETSKLNKLNCSFYELLWPEKYIDGKKAVKGVLLKYVVCYGFAHNFYPYPGR